MNAHKAMETIRRLFPHHTLINPYHKLHTPGMRLFNDYRQTLAGQSDALVFMPYGDEKIDAHMRDEIEAMLKKGGDVHELHVNPEGRPTGMMSHCTRIEEKRVLTMQETQAKNAATATLGKGRG